MDDTPERGARWTIGRRAVLAGGALGLTTLAGGAAEACTLTFNRNLPFDDTACRAALRAWIDLLNNGPDLPIDRIARVADEMSVTVDDDQMIDDAVGLSDGTQTNTERSYIFYQKFRLSNGRPDAQPIRLAGMHMIRRLRSRASYQFTLDRRVYVPAYENEGAGSCTGSSPEHYEQIRTSYIAAFRNNRLSWVRRFPEWYLEEGAR